MKNWHLSTKFLVNIFALAAVCAVTAFGQGTELSGTKWQLTHIDGREIGSTSAFIEINNDKTRFSGSTGCNRMFGSFEMIGNDLAIKGTGTTRMACLNGKVSLIEGQILTELGNAKGMRQNGDSLELLDGKRVALKFKAETPASAVKLEGKKWVLESLGEKAVTLAESKPFVNFDVAKGSLGGNTGCNVFGGSLTLKDDVIDASKMVSTMRACEEDDRMMIERHLLDGFEKADRFSIKGGKLMLYSKNELLLTFIGESK